MLRFDVFGRKVGIIREEGRWRAVFLGDEGKHRSAPGIAIPPDLEASELPRFLADLFHESARPDRQDVIPLGGLNAEVRVAARAPRLVFIVGASGVGKSTVAGYLQERPPWKGRIHFFDDIGVPTPEVMSERHGSGEEWQRWATVTWVAKLASRAEPLQLLEGQTRPSFIIDALASHPHIEPVILLLDCAASVRRHRLIELRGRPELVNAKMDSWAAYLRGQADALGLEVIDTTDLSVDEVAMRVEAICLAGLDLGTL